MNPDTENKSSEKILHHGYKSIRISFIEEEYERILTDNKYFKERLNFHIKHYPDLFPQEIKNGYRLCGFIKASKKQSITVRRIEIFTYCNPQKWIPELSTKKDLIRKIFLKFALSQLN